MILSITLNPAIDRVVVVEGLKVGDTNRVVRTERDAGGKGINSSRIIANLGGETLATGFLGGGVGAYIRSVLNEDQVPHEFVPIEEETRINTNIEDGGGGPPTTLNEIGPTISGAEWEQLIQDCRRFAKKASWATMGGSLPPGIPTDSYRILCEILIENGCKVCLDADTEALKEGIKARPHFIKPNTREAERFLGRKIERDDDAFAVARELLPFVQEFVVISRGAQGAVLASPEGVWNGTSPSVKANSTIGSGDTMIAGILWALGEGKGLEEAFRWGLAAGAATAETDGSEIAGRPEIEKLFPEAKTAKV